MSVVLNAQIIDRVLASVDSAIITQSDVYGVLRLGLVNIGGAPDALGAAVDRLIERRLILTEVDRYGPPEPPAEQIDKRLAELTGRFSAGRLDDILAESGLTRENLRRYVRDDLRIEAYLAQRFGAAIQPSEDEILQFYEQHQAAFTTSGAVRPFGEAHDAARDALVAERRAALITEWLAGLRKRANVSVLPR
jgi:hypothetical protein